MVVIVRLAWLVLPALPLLAAGCASGTKAGGKEQPHAVVLTIANHDGGDRDLSDYIAAVKRLSGGSIRLVVRDNWRSGEADYDRTTLGDVRAGKVDLAKVEVSSLDRLGVDRFHALTAPLLVDGLAIEERLLASRLPQKMLPGTRRLGVEGLAMLPGEPLRPLGLTRRLLAPSDYRSAVIANTPSLVSAITFRTLGATPRTSVSSELPPWIFDGAELDLMTIEEHQEDIEGSSLTTNVAFAPRALVLVANRRLLVKLTREQREILRSAGGAALAPAVSRLRNEDRVEAGILCRRGRTAFVAATPSQRAALRGGVRPVYAELERDPQTRAFIREIEAMKRRSRPEPAVRCLRALRPQEATSLLDGTWEMTASLARAGPSDAGRYRLVLGRGRVSFFHISPTGLLGAGVFRVHSDGTVAFRFANGEGGRFRWNVYRDTLTLSFVPGKEEGTPNLTFAPFHRVGR